MAGKPITVEEKKIETALMYISGVLGTYDVSVNQIDHFIAKQIELLMPVIKEDRKRLIEEMEKIDIDEGCEPDCTSDRHAYHQGRYDAQRILEQKVFDLKEKEL